MKITAKTKLCVVIGDPAEDSLSPQIHNAGYKKLNIDDEFVYVACRVTTEGLADFVSGAKAMGITGFGCKQPHKLGILAHLDKIDHTAKTIGAVNSVINKDGRLKGYNTDWLGIVKPLEALTELKGKKVALLGAGGAARAAAYGVTQKGAELTVYNRTLEKAQQLANEFGGQARSLDKLEEIENMDIIINATSVGLPLANDETPLDKQFINQNQIVFDAVYSTDDTRLLREAQQQGARIIHGTEMLLYQGMEQFKLFTGHDAPEEAMRKAFVEALEMRKGQ